MSKKATTEQPRKPTSTNQGEGNRSAAEDYNRAQREFVQRGEVDAHAAERRNLSEAERRAAERAEREGKRRAAEKDPGVVRDYAHGR
ncbi:MAG: hypothetical protein H6977_06280 [Gammaproteobacteria bacterium]|nr:hypothetical protein [Gammaproteobacteria bacterium]